MESAEVLINLVSNLGASGVFAAATWFLLRMFMRSYDKMTDTMNKYIEIHMKEVIDKQDEIAGKIDKLHDRLDRLEKIG